MSKKEIKFKCLFCGIEHISPNKYSSKAKYCSIKCQHEYQYKKRILEWKETGNIGKGPAKRYLSEKKEGCWECGITSWNNKSIVLELEHIDGNSDNNLENNLSLLCPNCHSQTETYKGKNVGKGRHSRRLRYKEGKSY